MTSQRDKWKLKVRIPRLLEAEGEGMVPTIFVAALAALMIAVVLAQVGPMVLSAGTGIATLFR